MAKNITVKVLNSKEAVETVEINTAGSDAVRIQAQSGVNYEFIDAETQHGPENITIRREGDDLLVAFEGNNIGEPDLIIEGYYNENGTNLLVGLHENGSYYPYVPESAQKADAVTMLADQVSAGQALGGEIISSPAFVFNPAWLLVPLIAAGVAAVVIASDDDDDDKSQNNQPADDTTDTDNDGIPDSEDTDDDGDGVSDADEEAAGLDPKNADSDGNGTPDGEEDADGDGLTNAEESDPESEEVTDADKDGKPDVTTPAADTTAPNAPVIEPNEVGEPIKGTAEPGSTVTVTYPDGTTAETTADENGNWEVPTNDSVVDGSEITATATDAEGNESDPATAEASDTIAPSAPTVAIANGDETITADEVEADGKVNVNIELPADAKAGDTLIVNGVEQVLTAEDITAGSVEVKVDAPAPEEKLEVSASLKDAAGNESDPATAEATREAEEPEVLTDVTVGIRTTYGERSFVDDKGTEDTSDDTVTYGTVERDSEASAVLTYEVYLNQAAPEDITVTVDLGGAADSKDFDLTAYYEANPNPDVKVIDADTIEVVIKKGETSASFNVDPIFENLAINGGEEYGGEGPETLEASIASATAATTSPIVNPDESIAEGIIIDSDPVALGQLTSDYSLVVGPEKDAGNLVASIQATNTLESNEALVTTNFDDLINIGYWMNGNPSNAYGNFSGGSAGTLNTYTDGTILRTTFDTAQGNDEVRVRSDFGALTSIYLGEGEDSLEVYGGLAGDSRVFAEAGNDKVHYAKDGAGQTYLGSGSDEITVEGNFGRMVDLGSGKPISSDEYMATYSDSVTPSAGYYVAGTSLGNDNNTDTAADTNTVTINGKFSGEIYGTAGAETITITGDSSGLIETRGSFAQDGSVFEDNVVDTVTVGTITGGDINLGAGDVLTQTGMTGGTVNYLGNDAQDVTFNGVEGGTINLGAGDDIITMASDFEDAGYSTAYDSKAGWSVDGGDGVDTLKVDGADKVVSMEQLSNIEHVDLTGTGNNTLHFRTPSASPTVTESLYIEGDAGDIVNLGDIHGIGADTRVNLDADGTIFNGAARNTWVKGTETTTYTDAEGATHTYDAWTYGGNAAPVVYIEQGITVL